MTCPRPWYRVQLPSRRGYTTGYKTHDRGVAMQVGREWSQPVLGTTEWIRTRVLMGDRVMAFFERGRQVSR